MSVPGLLLTGVVYCVLQPTVRTPQELARDDQELRELAALFDEPAVVTPAADKSSTPK